MSVLLISCSPYESGNSPDPVTPEMIVEKIQVSYETRNLGNYLECFESDFQFVLHEADLEYPDPNTCWYRDVDSIFTGNLFQGAYLIEFELEITQTFPWPEDSTAIGMICPFAL
ncbi:MAG: hypothetical protein KAR40_01955 [Candidatus Sabulitectum sp.]|nr:hypothetical protein [Candidatus Sabulitectum sp.]